MRKKYDRGLFAILVTFDRFPGAAKEIDACLSSALGRLEDVLRDAEIYPYEGEDGDPDPYVEYGELPSYEVDYTADRATRTELPWCESGDK